jgi:hypothetical protein
MAMTIEERRAKNREYMRRWREANPEKARSQTREAVRRYDREHREENRERARQYRATPEGQEASREAVRRYRAETVRPRVQRVARTIEIVFGFLPEERKQSYSLWLLDYAREDRNIGRALRLHRVDSLLATYSGF